MRTLLLHVLVLCAAWAPQAFHRWAEFHYQLSTRRRKHT